jgi:hypothetical protein
MHRPTHLIHTVSLFIHGTPRFPHAVYVLARRMFFPGTFPPVAALRPGRVRLGASPAEPGTGLEGCSRPAGAKPPGDRATRHRGCRLRFKSLALSSFNLVTSNTSQPPVTHHYIARVRVASPSWWDPARARGRLRPAGVLAPGRKTKRRMGPTPRRYALGAGLV